MLPAILAVTTGATLIGQWMASDKAQEIDEKRRNEIARAIAAFEQNYKMPDIDPTPITLEQYALLKEFAPKIASFIQEKMPQTVTESNSQDVIQVQKDAMNAMLKLGTQGSSGGDTQYTAQVAEGEVAAQNARKRQQADMLRQYASQGLAGGNQELLAGIANNQASETSQRLTNLNAAAANDGRRLDALRGAANQANALRGDNYRVETANNAVINSFNQRNASNQNQYGQYVAGLQNEAEKFNMGAAQRIADINVGLRNMNKSAAQQRKDLIERTNREAANDLAATRLQATTGQATMRRSDAQADLGRDLGMFNTAVTGAGSIASAYANQPNKPAEKTPDFIYDMEPDPEALERERRIKIKNNY